MTRSGAMTVLRWSEAASAWCELEGEAPEGFGGADVGLYETLPVSSSAYALDLHADRIARSWQALTGGPYAAEKLPSVHDARAEAIRRQWPGLRFEVRKFPDGSAVAQMRRRDRPSLRPPVRLHPVEVDDPDTGYPHKSVDRRHLTEAYQRAVAVGADDAVFVARGEVRETAQAFLGFVTVDALVLPPLRDDVLPSTTRTATADWCRAAGRAVIERPIRIDEVDAGTLIYGNALIGGVLSAVIAGRAAAPLPAWFSPSAIERRLAG